MEEETPAVASLLLHVGTYAHAGGQGLYPLRLAGDQWALGNPVPHIANASYGVWSRRHGIYHFVDEQAAGSINSCRYDGGRWTPLSKVASGGAAPCHIALNPAEDRLAVANYEDGRVAIHPVGSADGIPSGVPIVRQHRGRSVDPDRQTGPHAHCVIFSHDGRWLFHVDLGTDQIMAMPAGGEDPAGECHIAYSAPPGSGPRHLRFSPNGQFACLVSELSSSLTLFAHEDGLLVELDRQSTLPTGFSGDSLGGHIAFNAAGDRLYVSNRGHDSVALFAIDGDRLRLRQHVSSGGASPRFFHLAERQRRLIVANEEAQSVATFVIGKDGLLTAEARLHVPGAAFVIDTR